MKNIFLLFIIISLAGCSSNNQMGTTKNMNNDKNLNKGGFKMALFHIPKIKIPEKLDRNGFQVPLLASFTGIKRIPLVALSHNSLSPALTIYEDSLKYKVFKEKIVPYSEIYEVDILDTIGTKNVEIVFKNSFFTFSGNLFDKDNLLEVLKFFKRKNVNLSLSANRYLSRN
jgi:hypothetical protein